MKVAYVVTVSWGAVPHITAELANAISQYVDVTVLKPKDKLDYLFSKNVRILNAFEPLKFQRNDYLSALSLDNFKKTLSYKNINILCKLNPDLIVFQELYPHSVLFSWIFKIHKKYPTIYYATTAFDNIFIGKEEGIVYSLIATINEVMKRLIVPEKFIVEREEVKKTLIKRGISPENIAVIPLGAPSIRFYPEPNENRVLLFGSLVKSKGIEYFIEAVQIASKEIPIVGVIAGPGDISKYKKYIKNPTLFEIHNRYISEEEIPRIFASSKVVVLPYIFDDPRGGGQSGVLPLALSFGKPVIVTNTMRFLEIITDGKEGLIVPQRSSRALAEAMIKILNDHELRERMRENALRKAEELSWSKVAKMHLKVYEEVLSLWKRKSTF